MGEKVDKKDMRNEEMNRRDVPIVLGEGVPEGVGKALPKRHDEGGFVPIHHSSHTGTRISEIL